MEYRGRFFKPRTAVPYANEQSARLGTTVTRGGSAIRGYV